jgi:protein-disulfide isomerase
MTNKLLITALMVMLAGLAMHRTDAQERQLIPPALEARILAHPETPLAGGGATATVTIVEWFDYNCPFCRKTHSHVQQLLHTNPSVRVLYKEWPIFGRVSDYAARSALAATWQRKYLRAHDALLGTPQALTETTEVVAVLNTAGIDLTRLQHDRNLHAAEIEAIIARSEQEARTLGLRGTPGFLIGRQLVSRSLNLSQLQELLQEPDPAAANE